MVGTKWDGKISNLNISELAFPELYCELSQMQHKARSDRLRSLALLGLYSLRFFGKMSPFAQQDLAQQFVPFQPELAQTDSKLDSQRDSLKRKLMSTV